MVGEVGAATAKATQTARQTREAYEPEAPPNASEDSPSPSHRFEPPEDVNSVDYHTREHDLEPGYVPDDEQPVPSSPPVRYSPPTTAASVLAEAEYEGRRRPLSYGGMARFLVVLSILAGVVATINWQWSTITGLYQHLSHMESKPQTQASHEMPSAQPKFSGLAPQEQNTGRAPDAAAPNGQTAPAVAQRVVFYEEDPNDQQGRRYVGSAIWRTDTVSPASGFEPEPAVRADVEIPERRMTVTWSLRRNTDKALAASHTIEITFNLPADFPGGGIANVPGILMKQAEQARGTPLSELAVKVTNDSSSSGCPRWTLTCSTTCNSSKSVPGSTSRSSTPMAAAPSWRWKKAHQGTTPSPRLFAKGNEPAGALVGTGVCGRVSWEQVA